MNGVEMEYQLKVVMCDLGPPLLNESVVKLFGTILCYCQCDQSKNVWKACLGHFFRIIIILYTSLQVIQSDLFMPYLEVT